MKRLQALILAASTVIAAGCFIDAGSFAGKSCETSNDCPSPYTCVQVRIGGRTCELVHGLEGGSYGTGTGGGSGAGGGGPSRNPDYCHDVKPILDRTCISNCHGLAMDYPGTRQDFRLDYYAPSGANTLPGAKAKAVGAGCVAGVNCIKTRVSDDTMPPASATPRPSSAERSLIIKWVNTGATECNDSGSSPVSDAGTTDAGSADAGDGG